MIAERGAQREGLAALGDREIGDACAAPEAGDVEAWTIRVRTFEAVAGQRTIDEFGIEGFQGFVIKAGPRQTAGAHVGEEDVGVLHHLPDQRLTFRFAGVDDDGFLAAIVEIEDGIVLQVGADGAEEEANGIAAGRLDLGDVCAPVAQDAPGARRCHVCRVFDDLDAFKHARSSCFLRKGVARSARNAKTYRGGSFTRLQGALPTSAARQAGGTGPPSHLARSGL